MPRKIKQKKREVFEAGKIYTPRRWDLEDNAPGTVSPLRARNAILNAGRGDPEKLIEIFRWARRVDLTLEGAFEDRLGSLTGLEWRIVPATDRLDPDQHGLDVDRAKEAANFCERQLRSLSDFDGFLDHNAEAIMYSNAVTEIVWRKAGKGHEIDRLVCVEPTALWGDVEHPSLMRVATAEFDTTGELISDHPNSFIVHWPKKIGPTPWSSGLMIGTTLLANSKKYGWQWFERYTELFGMPYRMGKFHANAGPEEKSALERALKTVGTEGYAMFDERTAIELIESQRGGEGTAHEKLIDTIDKWYSIAIRGGQLNAEVGETGGGSFSLGQVHERVAGRIRQRDQKAESNTIREQLLRPMIELSKLAGSPIPFFERQPLENKNRLEEGQIIQQGLANGMEIERKYAHDRMGIPMPEGAADSGDTLLPLPDNGLSSFPVSPFGFPSAVAAVKKK